MRTGRLCGQAQAPLSLRLRLRLGLSFSDLAQAQESGSIGSSQNGWQPSDSSYCGQPV